MGRFFLEYWNWSFPKPLKTFPRPTKVCKGDQNRYSRLWLERSSATQAARETSCYFFTKKIFFRYCVLFPGRLAILMVGLFYLAIGNYPRLRPLRTFRGGGGGKLFSNFYFKFLKVKLIKSLVRDINFLEVISLGYWYPYF